MKNFSADAHKFLVRAKAFMFQHLSIRVLFRELGKFGNIIMTFFYHLIIHLVICSLKIFTECLLCGRCWVLCLDYNASDRHVSLLWSDFILVSRERVRKTIKSPSSKIRCVQGGMAARQNTQKIHRHRQQYGGYQRERGWWEGSKG